MRKKIIIGVVLLLVAVVFLHKSNARVMVDGALITIESAGHRIEGTLEPVSTHQFIMKDEGVSINTFSGDAFVTVLPLKTAEELRAQYEDFFRCNAPNAGQAMRSMRGVVLVTDSDQAREAIYQALALVRKSRIPVVSFNGSRILVKQHVSMNMNVVDKTGTLLYYVNDFKILKADYLR